MSICVCMFISLDAYLLTRLPMCVYIHIRMCIWVWTSAVGPHHTFTYVDGFTPPSLYLCARMHLGSLPCYL